MSYMLTTVDNPYNPYTNFDEWLNFDTLKGYDTLGYLARVTPSSNDLSAPEQEKFIEDSIDEIVRLNIRGIYKKIEGP